MARRPSRRTAPTAEVGYAGLVEFGGRVHEEFLPELRQPLRDRVYAEMRDNDPIVGAMLFAIEALARQVEWTVEPGDEDAESVAAAEFVKSCLDDLDQAWSDFLAEALSFVSFGWAYHEVVYKRRVGPDEADPARRSRFTDNRFGWRKFPLRAQETLDKWELADDGEILGMHQRTAKGEVAFVPINKAIHFRTTTRKSNPEGRSILRNAYRPWYFKKRLETIEAIGVERELAGLPMMYVPPDLLAPNAPADKVAALNEVKNLVRNVRADEQAGLVLPAAFDPETGNRLWEFSLVSTAGRRAIDPEVPIQRYARWIAMSVLADFILLGHEKVGSFALASSKTNLFATALGGYLDQLEEVFHRMATRPLLNLNGIAAEARMVHGDVETIDLKELFEAIANATLAGLDVSDLEDEFRRRAGWPERTIDSTDDDGSTRGRRLANEPEDDDDPPSDRPRGPTPATPRDPERGRANGAG